MTPAAAATAISLKTLAITLARRKRQIVITFLVLAAGVAAGTCLMPKQYETRLKVLVKNEGGSAYRSEVGEAQINSEIELLSSNDLMEQVAGRCGLGRLQLPAGAPSANLDVAVERAVANLRRHLRIAPVHKANVIQVEYEDVDPHRAVVVLKELAGLYLEAHLRLHGTPGAYEFFKSQAEHYQRELQKADAGLAAFRRRENIVMLSEQKGAMLLRTTEAEAALLQVESAIGEYTQRIADTRRQLGAAAPRVVTQSRIVPNQYSVERIHTMLVELNNRRTQLLAKFRADDRMVAEVDQEIAETRTALDKAERLTGVEQSTDNNPLHQALQIDLAKQRAEAAGLEARRQSLVMQAAEYRELLTRLAEATTTFDNLTRDRKEAEDNYLLYAKKAEEARIAESLDRQKISNVAIAETPVEPHAPSRPNVPFNIALGLPLAAVISLGAALAAEHLRDSIEEACDLEMLTGLPVLATVYRS